MTVLASTLTHKAKEQADAIERLVETCERCVAYKDPVDFYQAKGKPLRCTFTHKQEGVSPSKRWILNVAAVQQKASDQVAQITQAIANCKRVLNQCGDVDAYTVPSGPEDFFEDDKGDLHLRYRWGKPTGDTEFTLPAKSLAAFAVVPG